MMPVVFLLVAAIGQAGAQPDGAASFNIPREVYDAFAKPALASKYAVSYRINPFYLQGDFNGDHKGDYAVLITETASGKSGLAIVHGGTKRVTILGAGTTFDGQNDLDWMDVWSVYAHGTVERGVGEGRPPILRGDAILAEHSESASGLIYWTGSRYAWYQQGD